MNTNGILATDGQRLAAFAYSDPVCSDVPRIEWRGVTYSQPECVAEWLEVRDATGRLVGVELVFARDYHPPFWRWLHRFPNVTLDEFGGATINFGVPNGSERASGGPFLPVHAFTTGDDENFVVYIPELF